jgi:hypothetical protein
MKYCEDVYWWILSAFLACALGATEVYTCNWTEGIYSCELISDTPKLPDQGKEPTTIFSTWGNSDEEEQADTGN